MPQAYITESRVHSDKPSFIWALFLETFLWNSRNFSSSLALAYSHIIKLPFSIGKYYFHKYEKWFWKPCCDIRLRFWSRRMLNGRKWQVRDFDKSDPQWRQGSQKLTSAAFTFHWLAFNPFLNHFNMYIFVKCNLNTPLESSAELIMQASAFFVRRLRSFSWNFDCQQHLLANTICVWWRHCISRLKFQYSLKYNICHEQSINAYMHEKKIWVSQTYGQ